MMSLPPREAWIEIAGNSVTLNVSAMSLPPREAWIEIMTISIYATKEESLPPREAWIEI